MVSALDWSVTPGSNTALGGEAVANDMDTIKVDDVMRIIAAAAKSMALDLGGATSSGGSANGYTFTSNGYIRALANGARFSFKANHTCAGASTMVVTPSGESALASKAIRKFTQSGEAALSAGDIISGGSYSVEYNEAANGAAGAWILLNPTVIPLFGTETFYLPASAFIPTITNGAQRYLAEDATNDLMEDSLAFDTTTQEFATVDFVLPKRWALGTITCQPYWRGTGSSSQTVVWGFSGVAISDDDAADTAPGSVVTSSDTWIADSDLHIGPASGAMTISGTPADGDLIRLKVQRNVSSDDLSGDARLQGVLVTITTDQANDA